MSDVLLEARGLVKSFRSQSVLRGSHETRALDGVDLQIRVGEVLAVIGESGSGKTTLGKVLLRLTPATEGTITFDGQDLLALRGKTLRVKRREFQMVFQNQRANLHPKMTVRQMLDESLRLHRPGLDGEGRAEHISGLLDRVGLSQKAEQKPESLSGGERRRVGLARILATQPKLIVADEPTSGLDAAIKLQIIELLRRLKESSMTYMLISHDLGLVRRIADRVMVMLKGQIIEEIPAERLGDPRHHPYTGRLMRAAVLSEDHASLGPSVIESDGQDGEQSAAGCVYAADCPVARERGLLNRCRRERPEPVALGPGHWVACFASSNPSEEEA